MSTSSLDSSLVLNESGSKSTSPSRLPRMFVENQPLSPSMRVFSIGASTVLTSVWPVLKSLPQIGTSCSLASCVNAGVSKARLVRSIAIGTTFLDRGPGIEHRRSDVRIVAIHAGLEGMMLWWTGAILRNTSVEPVHRTTTRLQPSRF